MDDKTLGILVGGAVVGGILGAIVMVAKLIGEGLRSPTEGGRRLRTVANVVVLLVLALFGVQVLGWAGALVLAVVALIVEWVRRGFKQ